MEEYLESILRPLLSHPKVLEVKNQRLGRSGKFVTLRVKVHPKDKPIVIGKKGSTIRAAEELTRKVAPKGVSLLEIVVE
jgi:predicted RNA-binding protein YlqC (UPF0109 family)